MVASSGRCGRVRTTQPVSVSVPHSRSGERGLVGVERRRPPHHDLVPGAGERDVEQAQLLVVALLGSALDLPRRGSGPTRRRRRVRRPVVVVEDRELVVVDPAARPTPRAAARSGTRDPSRRGRCGRRRRRRRTRGGGGRRRRRRRRCRPSGRRATRRGRRSTPGCADCRSWSSSATWRRSLSRRSPPTVPSSRAVRPDVASMRRSRPATPCVRSAAAQSWRAPSTSSHSVVGGGREAGCVPTDERPVRDGVHPGRPTPAARARAAGRASRGPRRCRARSTRRGRRRERRRRAARRGPRRPRGGCGSSTARSPGHDRLGRSMVVPAVGGAHRLGGEVVGDELPHRWLLRPPRAWSASNAPWSRWAMRTVSGAPTVGPCSRLVDGARAGPDTAVADRRRRRAARRRSSASCASSSGWSARQLTARLAPVLRLAWSPRGRRTRRRRGTRRWPASGSPTSTSRLGGVAEGLAQDPPLHRVGVLELVDDGHRVPAAQPLGDDRRRARRRRCSCRGGTAGRRR